MLPTIDYTVMALIFSTALTGFATIWGIKKAISLF